MSHLRRPTIAFLTAGLFLLLMPGATFGQESPRQTPDHNLESFAPLDFPDPNRYRTADGRPGPAYWQSEADYQIDVRLDTARRRLTGTQTITYTNNSPQDANQG